METRKWFIWTWVVFGVILISGGIYHTLTVQGLERELEATNDGLARIHGELSEDIVDLDTLLSEQIAGVAGELRTSVAGLQEEITERQQELQGKISAVEQSSQAGIEQLQQDVKNINIQTQDFTAIIQDVLAATVSVFTDSGLGSGAIVHEDGYVVTNYHVVAGISAGGIQTYDKRTHAMRIVATDPQNDLALLQMQTDRNYPHLRFADSGSVKVGTKVIAAGNPVGLDFTITEGIVSAVDRTDANGVRVIQTDVPINPGNSGGPLVNIESRIVGINTYKAAGYEGLGFAVEADVVEDFIDDAIAQDQAE